MYYNPPLIRRVLKTESYECENVYTIAKDKKK